MPDVSDLDALRAIIGEPWVMTSETDRVSYEAAARYASGEAAAIIRPRDTREVSAVVACLVSRGLRFVPQSGNSGLVQGSVPDATGAEFVLSLDRLREHLDIDPADRSATVSAGVRLSELNLAAEPHGLFLPIDLGADPMIGGMVATNTGGARFLRHGGMREHVLALTVVLPDDQGTVLEIASGLRKDNSRLDLRSLFVGSSGALGIVTQATVELARRPRQTAAALLVPRSPAEVPDLLTAMEGAVGEFLTAFEGMSRPAMQAAFDHLPSLRNPFAGGVLPDYALLIELTTVLDEQVLALDGVLQAALESLIMADDSPLTDALFGDVGSIWALRHGLSEGLRAAGQVIGFDLSFRRAEIFGFRDETISILAREFPECQVCDFGHVGDGGVHFNILVRNGPLDRIRSEALHDLVLMLAVERHGGSFSGEHGIGRINQLDYDRFVPASTQSYSGAVARAFAPIPVGAARFGPARPAI